MTTKPINFEQVESLRRHMLLTVSDICRFFDATRQTYYNWKAGSYPRKTVEARLRKKIRQLLYLLTEKNWPTPDVIAANPKDRYGMLIAALGENNEAGTSTT